MTALNRRLFLSLVSAGPFAALLGRLAPASRIVEVIGASVFFAPYHIERLLPGCRLALEARGDLVYLTLDGALIGRLPAGLPWRGLRAVVSSTGRDDDGRLRLFVRVGGDSAGG